MRILVVNPGSSSLKLRVLAGGGSVVAAHDVPCAQGCAESAELHDFIAGLGGAGGNGAAGQGIGAAMNAAGDGRPAPAIDAAGVRFVHGGADFRRSVLVDPGVLDALAATGDLAPLHNPPAVDALRALAKLWPGLPVVACFDTAFFAGLPPAAATFAVPRQWTEEWGIRRFGFHGLSHQWASRRAAELVGRSGDPGFRVVTCHLGAGASLAAVRGGTPLDTTMGFTPLDGLVMATRCGALDPGVLLRVQRHHGLTPDDLDRILDRESGLLGMCGSADIRDVVAAAGSGEEAAGLALDVYLGRLRGSVAAMAAALGGLDALAFTGGVGEHSPVVRSGTCDALPFLGLTLDAGANTATPPAATPDRLISRPHAPTPVLVIEAREDLAIAAEVRRLASPPGALAAP